MFKAILSFFSLIIGAIVGAMFATGDDTHLESDGDALDVDLTATVTAKQVIYVDGWLGVAVEAGESGDTVALDISAREYQFTVPTALSVSKGDTVFIDTAQVTGHSPDGAGYAKATGAGLIPLFKATADQDANDIVTGVLVTKFN